MAADCQPTASPAAVAVIPVVVMQVKLPYTASTFTPEVQDNFKIGVAKASSTGCGCSITKDNVTITKVSPAQRRVEKPPAGGTRRQASEGLTVDFSIAVADTEQGSALVQSGSLGKDSLNEELAEVGVAPITEITQSPEVTEVTQSQETTGASGGGAGETLTLGTIAGLTLGLIAVVLIFIGILLYLRRDRENVLSPEQTAQLKKEIEKILEEDKLPAGRTVGDLKDFKSGKFQDAAKGIKSFLGVRKSWHKAKECTTEGIIAEVKRLCDCQQCAIEQARVLEKMKRSQEAKLTRRLADELARLQEARNKDEPVEHHQKRVDATRDEMEAFGGWVYGRVRSTPGSKMSEKQTSERKQKSHVVSLSMADVREDEIRPRNATPGAAALASLPATGKVDDSIQLPGATTWPVDEDGDHMSLQSISPRSNTESMQDAPTADDVIAKDVEMTAWKRQVEGCERELSECLSRIATAFASEDLEKIQQLVGEVKRLKTERDALNAKRPLRMPSSLAVSTTIADSRGLSRSADPDAVHSEEATRDDISEAVETSDIVWPEEEVKHQWGHYGQPMCDKCKELSLDFSTIWADLHYILYERTSEKECFNGTRDLGQEDQVLADFMNKPQVREADLSEAQLVALRFYTSHSFHALNKPLRQSPSGLKWRKTENTARPPNGRELICDKLASALRSNTSFTDEEWTSFEIKDLRYDDWIKSGDSYFRPDEAPKPHPLPATVMCITDGLKQLRALDAESDEATQTIELYRGFTDMQVTEEFKKKGGSEAAPMSTSKSQNVACGYAIRNGKRKGALLMKIVTTNNLQRGADLSFLSMFPGEEETLYPPLTFVQPTGREQVVEHGDFKLTIIEVTTTLP